MSRPQRLPQRCSALAPPVATEPQYVCGAATPGGHLTRESKQNPPLTADCARPWTADKNVKIRAQEECVS
jgi:hypothetical protein